jgi:integrase/recombinase XerC
MNHAHALQLTPSAGVPLLDQEGALRLLKAFLSGRSPRTIEAYSRDLEDFRTFTGAPDVDGAARWLLSRGPGGANALALEYRAHLLDRGLQPATVNRRLASLRSLVKLARTLGLVMFGLEVQNVKGQAYRDTRGPGLAGIRVLLRQLHDRQDAKGRRDLAIIRLLYDLGLRRGEIVRLDLGDIDLEGKRLWVIGKGRTQKEALSLPEPTRSALAAWLEIRSEEPGPLFPNADRAGKGSGRLTGSGLYKLVRRLGAEVGLHTRPHGIRHTAVTEAVKAAQAHGIGLEEVLSFSRHSSVTTLMVYRDRERNVQGQLAGLVAAGA